MDREPGSRPDPGLKSEQFWYDYLTRGDGMERRVRGVFKLIPASPRCQLCAAPFAGLGAPVMRALGKHASVKNPRVCSSCFDFMERHHGGAEIEATFLFADIRGSTAIAERIPARQFSALLDRFYAVATQVVFDHDGSVDKFVGDELVAAFFPLMSGDRHVTLAIDAATSLLRATGHGSAQGPWVPVGAGVHSGMAWVGAVGDANHTELTAVGDTVNTTARLAAAAATGEVLVTASAARTAGIDGETLERRSLELKGKQGRTDVVVLRAEGGRSERMG
ncbi:MAG TPA: adenylate/guanylate cyclase domain-containing protein [Candidatus Limnocylindrales bacterium]